MQPVVRLIERAQENFDGSGPLALKGQEIPLESRILAVALERPEEVLDPELLADQPLAIDSVGAENLVRLARRQAESSHFETALATLSQALELSQQFPDLRLEMGRARAEVLGQQGRFQSARQELLTLLQEAERQELDLVFAELALQAAELEDWSGREAALDRAEAIFELWERHHDLARLRVLRGAADPVDQETDSGVLRVEMLGGVRLSFGATVLNDDHRVSRKDRSLFCYLAYHAGQPQHEEKLMDLFWPRGGKKALHSLHNSISQIGKTLAHLLPERAKRTIQKKRDGYVFGAVVDHTVDVHLFRQALARAGRAGSEAVTELHEADQLYQGEFLEGTYEAWAEPLRVQLAQELTDCRLQLADHFTRQQKFSVAVQLWQRVNPGQAHRTKNVKGPETRTPRPRWGG